MYQLHLIPKNIRILNITKFINWIIYHLSIYFSGRMELLWLFDCGSISSRANPGRGKGVVHVAFIPSSSCLQVGQIVEITKWHFDNHGKYCRRSVQFNIRPLYHCIHICRYGNAAIRQRLYWICLWKVGLWTTSMELHWLLAQFYDSVPCSLWRMDWVHVGLPLGCRKGMCSIFPCYCTNRKFSHS